MSATADLLDAAKASYGRSISLSGWRWLARRNALNRSIWLSKLAYHSALIDRATPKLTECPICAEWAENHERCVRL